MEELSSSSNTCKRCNKPRNQGAKYCGTSCANKSRKHSQETKDKISKSISTSTKFKQAMKTRDLSYFRTEEYSKHKSKCMKDTYQKKLDHIWKTKPMENWNWRTIKLYMYKKYKNKCQECGYYYKDKKGLGPFDIHHIDGNHGNNKKDNLQFLCKNCHWKTDNFGFRGRTHTEETKNKYLRKPS